MGIGVHSFIRSLAFVHSFVHSFIRSFVPAPRDPPRCFFHFTSFHSVPLRVFSEPFLFFFLFFLPLMKIPFFSTMRSSSSSRRKSQQQEQQQQQHESQEVLASGGGGDGDESATKCTRKGHKVHPDTDDTLAGPVTGGVLAMSGHARDVDVDNVKE